MFGPVRPLTDSSSAASEGMPPSLCWRQGALGDRRWIWGSRSLRPVKSHAHSPITGGAVSPTLTQLHTRCHWLLRGHPHPVLCSSAYQAPSGYPTQPRRAAPTSLGRPAVCKAGLSIQAERAPEPRCPASTRIHASSAGLGLGLAGAGQAEGWGGSCFCLCVRRGRVLSTSAPAPGRRHLLPGLPSILCCLTPQFAPLSCGLWLGGTGAPGLSPGVEGRR